MSPPMAFATPGASPPIPALGGSRRRLLGGTPPPRCRGPPHPRYGNGWLLQGSGGRWPPRGWSVAAAAAAAAATAAAAAAAAAAMAPPPPPPPTSLDALPAHPFTLVWTPPPPGRWTPSLAPARMPSSTRAPGSATSAMPNPCARACARTAAACRPRATRSRCTRCRGGGGGGGDPRAAMEAVLDGWVAAAGAVPDGNAADRARWEEDPPGGVPGGGGRRVSASASVPGGGPPAGAGAQGAPAGGAAPPPPRAAAADDGGWSADAPGDARGVYDPLDPFSAARSPPSGEAARRRRRRQAAAAAAAAGAAGGRSRGGADAARGGGDDDGEAWAARGRGRDGGGGGGWEPAPDEEWSEREDWVPIVGVAVIAGFLWLATSLAGGGGGLWGGGRCPCRCGGWGGGWSACSRTGRCGVGKQLVGACSGSCLPP
ncbi:hypothetical protein BU14_0532s0014 [Porphyra umbilicalis]|uniref:Uncharacterized protein n=1 Tax=Porphyra umbilicalis TaxID=2786 RepID=A0A1X6NSU1_PORUM|nr:hypothetical protein BU14_0532s0014 [Porphyra umbilicalis]|eukprot:OSX71453.1 hypothetical protein BU14_0532s0014 [Porphyra umbilicalis]